MGSVYAGSKVILTTKHQKAEAIAPVFQDQINAVVEVFEADTDELGTFTGEISRQGNAMECARRKCQIGIDHCGINLGIASEGSFGPHPEVPMFPCDYEILYFIDRIRGFDLPVTLVSEKTNYRTSAIDSVEQLQIFAQKSLFPTHALIVRPNEWEDKTIIFKGIRDKSELIAAFQKCSAVSSDRRSWVETDMRAHMNPSRMAVIRELSHDLALRLKSTCPACESPGWGLVDHLTGLPCEFCRLPTDLVLSEIWGCVQCAHRKQQPRSDGLVCTPQRYCNFCNP